MIGEDSLNQLIFKYGGTESVNYYLKTQIWQNHCYAVIYYLNYGTLFQMER